MPRAGDRSSELSHTSSALRNAQPPSPIAAQTSMSPASDSLDCSEPAAISFRASRLHHAVAGGAASRGRRRAAHAPI
ncbi:hypothetical protein CDD83_1328 [Cordyceps sp. RAO-2017]|nr:hypothetical protein CDD83_1328 [Cordyceps sp. RAO-2017]